MTETRPSGIACGSCGTILPTEWVDEPRDQRSPCPKCRGTQRRTAIAKSPNSAPSTKPQSPRGRLIAVSVVLAVTAAGLLAWWFLR